MFIFNIEFMNIAVSFDVIVAVIFTSKETVAKFTLSLLLWYAFSDSSIGIELHFTLSIVGLFNEGFGVIFLVLIKISVHRDELIAIIFFFLDELFVQAFKKLIAIIFEFSNSFVKYEHAQHKNHKNRNLNGVRYQHGCFGIYPVKGYLIHNIGL